MEQDSRAAPRGKAGMTDATATVSTLSSEIGKCDKAPLRRSGREGNPPFAHSTLYQGSEKPGC